MQVERGAVAGRMERYATRDPGTRRQMKHATNDAASAVPSASSADDVGLRHTDVPYYPQWGSPDWVRAIVDDDADPCDDPAWQRSGFTDPERYRFWADRLCGL